VVEGEDEGFSHVGSIVQKRWFLTSTRILF
jgi:hypothetical protein